MLKKIIFDVDNTLLNWDIEKYWHGTVQELLKENEYPCDREASNKMRRILDQYEKDNFAKPYVKKDMITYFNKGMEINLNEKSINRWIELLSECAPTEMEFERYELLDYLEKKYDLAVLTNWLDISQEKRLEKSKMSKYFKEIYATENIPRKPNRLAYMTAIGENKPEECIMVGDSLIDDIQGALDAGLKAIWLDHNNICKEKIMYDEQNREFQVIHKLEELKEIL